MKFSSHGDFTLHKILFFDYPCMYVCVHSDCEGQKSIILEWCSDPLDKKYLCSWLLSYLSSVSFTVLKVNM